jgi:putative transcriptional regulator
MIRCHLSRLMGEKRVRLIEVARGTGVNRNLLAKLYHDRARRIDLDDVEKLCRFFECGVGELLELIADGSTPAKRTEAKSADSGRKSNRR